MYEIGIDLVWGRGEVEVEDYEGVGRIWKDVW